MAVVRVADKLLKEIKALLNEDRNKYQYPSVSAFINCTIYEKLAEVNNKDKKRR
jgi:hypothetical protein